MSQEHSINLDLNAQNPVSSRSHLASSRKQSHDTMRNSQIDLGQQKSNSIQRVQEASAEGATAVGSAVNIHSQPSPIDIRAQNKMLDSILAKSQIIQKPVTQQLQSTIDSSEVTHRLFNLHSKVDKILSPTKVVSTIHASSPRSIVHRSAVSSALASPYTSPNKLYASASKNVRFVDDLKYSPLSSATISLSSSPYVNTLALAGNKGYSSDKTTHYYPHSALLPRQADNQLGYDKEKLDRIIGGVVRNSYTATSAAFRPSYTSNSDYNRPSYKPEPIYIAQHQQNSQPISETQPKKPANSFGEAEYDQDSIIDERLEDNMNHLETEEQNHVNFYVGSLIDDLDESPRKKRAGQRQAQHRPSRSTSVKPSNSSSELVKKGPYERKVKEKLNPVDLKKHFDKDVNLIEDFDFSRKVKVGRH